VPDAVVSLSTMDPLQAESVGSEERALPLAQRQAITMALAAAYEDI